MLPKQLLDEVVRVSGEKTCSAAVWVAVLRRRDPIDIDTLVDFGDVVTCPPIVQEVLQGIGDPNLARVSALRQRAL